MNWILNYFYRLGLRRCSRWCASNRLLISSYRPGLTSLDLGLQAHHLQRLSWDDVVSSFHSYVHTTRPLTAASIAAPAQPIADTTTECGHGSNAPFLLLQQQCFASSPQRSFVTPRWPCPALRRVTRGCTGTRPRAIRHTWFVRSQTRSSAIASWKATTDRCLYAIINGASQQHGARASLLARAPRVRLPTVVYFSSCVLCCQIESKGEAHI
jgi:hypothetical protein